MTALQAEGCGGALRAQIIKEGGAAGAAGCVEGLRRFRSGGRQPFGPRVMVAPFGRRFYKKEARPIVISTVARSGEIPSDGTGGITLGDLSTQSFIKAFSICPIPTCGSARDDGVGERPHRHFDRSKAEWRNLTPPWYRKHWGGRSLDSEFHRSGFPLTPIPAHPPARDDDIGGHPYRHFDRSGAEWRNLTPQWAKKELGFRRWLFRRAALPSLWGREADQSAR